MAPRLRAVSANGKLFLGINDFIFDNAGMWFLVTIEVTVDTHPTCTRGRRKGSASA